MTPQSSPQPSAPHVLDVHTTTGLVPATTHDH